MTESVYVHGTHPTEQRRLELMNQILNQRALRELALRGGERVIDFGCGLGALARQIARETGNAVVGIERSDEQIAEARRLARAAGEMALIDIRQGDATKPPLSESELGSFDVAHARFLLEHVPDPLAVVRAMLQSVRTGGRVVLQDDDHEMLKMWPDPPGFSALWSAYARSYDRNRNDHAVGRRLVELLYRAGARPLRNSYVFFGGCSGEPVFSALVENVIEILLGAKETILTLELFDRRYFHEVIASIRDWQFRRDAALWYAVSWAEGVRD